MNIEIPSVKSLFIEMRFQETLLSSATATLVAKDRGSHCTLITARHNVTGRHQDTGQCLHKQAAVPDGVTIYFPSGEAPQSKWVPIRLPLYRNDGSPFWIEHPKLGSKADIVALNLKWGSDVSKYPYYLETDLDRFGLVIGPAETVSVMGFPFGMLHNRRFPVWATGFMAQEMAFVSDENPTFLIDCRARPGQSGSPVIAFRPSGYRNEQDGRVVTTFSAKKVWEFLGVYSGRVHAESDLGVVWHTSAVRELLDAAQREFEKREELAAPPSARRDTPSS